MVARSYNRDYEMDSPRYAYENYVLRGRRVRFSAAVLVLLSSGLIIYFYGAIWLPNRLVYLIGVVEILGAFGLTVYKLAAGTLWSDPEFADADRLYELQSQRRKALMILTVYCFAAVSGLGAFYFQEFFSENTAWVLRALAFGGTLFVVAFGLYSYLSGDNSRTIYSAPPQVYEGDSENIQFRLDRLENSYRELLKATSKAKDIDIDLDNLLKSVEEKALDQMPAKVADALTKRFAAKAVEEAQINNLRLGVEQSKMRLRDQVDASMRRSNLNLIIGILTTALAAGILGFVTLFENRPEFVDMTRLLAHYIPRISTIIFIEVFAFFFLRLYKAGIQETKYFQNELTNIESRAAAIEGALIKGQSTGTQDIIKQLVRTDRNQHRIAENGEKEAAIDIKAWTPVVEALSKVSGKGS